MKRVIVYSLLCFFVFLAKNSRSQANVMFWYETFGLGCSQGSLASGAVLTPSNVYLGSTWLVNSTLTPGGNGANPNEWFVSATEAGRPVGTCGDGCLNNAGLTNRSLHIGSSVIGPGFDIGAYYLQSGTSNTDARAESPLINCAGKNNITLSFNYLANGNITDFCDVYYGISGTWTAIAGGTLAPSVGTCAPQGLWTNATYLLPSACDGQTIQIGFRWRNSATPGPGNISVAIDEVMLLAPEVTFTTPLFACPNVCFTPSVTAPFIVPAPTTYSWVVTPSVGVSISNSTSATPCITVPTVGIYAITCAAMNGAALTASVTNTINVVSNIAFTLTSTPANTLCLGESVNLTAFGGASYTWSPAATLNQTVGASVFASPTIATTYSVVGTDVSGCPGTGSVQLTLGQAPVLSVVSTASAVCTGFTSTLTATGAGSYSWTGTNIPTVVTSPSIAVGPGTYTVCGGSQPILPCTTCSVVNIGTQAPLNIQISQNHFTTCIANNYPKYSLPVKLQASGASVYTWSPNASLNYSIGSSVDARPPASTCYTVTGLTSVCEGTAIVCVTVVPQFTMDVIPKQPILCLGDSLTLKIANIGTTSIAPYKYNWMEPGNAPPPSLSDPMSGTVQIAPTNSSVPITYTAEVYDSRGCVSDPRLVTTTVLPQPITAIGIPTLITGGTAVQTNTVCYVGNTVGSDPSAYIQYTAALTNSNVLPPGVQPTYTWIPPYNAPYVANVTPANSNTIILTAPLRLPAQAVYTIISGYNGISGCTRVDTVSVRVIDCRAITNAIVDFTTAITNDTICSRTCVTFLNLVDTAAGGPQTYLWKFQSGAPATSTLANPTICYNLPGNYNVSLEVSNPFEKPLGSHGIKGKQRFIKVVDIPNPKILPPLSSGKDTVIRFGMAVTLTATNALNYSWSPNYHISNTTGSVVTVSPLQNTQYVLTGRNSSQCFSRDTINVIVVEDCGQMFVPNAFSPNGDGNNDVLRVRGLCLQTMTFIVFNRWGEKVFESSDINEGWDGTFNGEPMNTGVFVYRVEGKTYDGKAFSMKGNVTLIR